MTKRAGRRKKHEQETVLRQDLEPQVDITVRRQPRTRCFAHDGHRQVDEAEGEKGLPHPADRLPLAKPKPDDPQDQQNRIEGVEMQRDQLDGCRDADIGAKQKGQHAGHGKARRVDQLDGD